MTNTGLGALANGRLFTALLARDDQTGQYQGLAQVHAEMDKIGVQLMVQHVQTLNTFHGITPVQVADYHFQVFGEHDLPRDTFGGTPLAGMDWEASVSAPIWMHCQ